MREKLLGNEKKKVEGKGRIIMKKEKSRKMKRIVRYFTAGDARGAS